MVDGHWSALRSFFTCKEKFSVYFILKLFLKFLPFLSYDAIPNTPRTYYVQFNTHIFPPDLIFLFFVFIAFLAKIILHQLLDTPPPPTHTQTGQYCISRSQKVLVDSYSNDLIQLFLKSLFALTLIRMTKDDQKNIYS
jgi:hypothetical protein